MSAVRRFAQLSCVAVALFGAWACADTPVPTAEDGPELTRRFHPGGEDGDQDFVRPSFMTGGGRIDCSAGEPHPCAPVKSTPQSRDFQTFGFNFGDKDGDGTVEGQLQHVDHRDALRMGGSPRNYHSVSWSFYEPIDPAPFCGGGGDGAARAGGTIERKNDGTTWAFEVRVVDCGEPGTKDPHDIYGIRVADGYEVDGELTGGNIQAHFKGGAAGTATASGSPSGEASGARAQSTTGGGGPAPHASQESGNYDEDSAPSLDLAGLVQAEDAHVVTTGGSDSGETTSESVSTLANVNVLSGLITADRVTAIAASAIDEHGATSNADGSQFSNLVVNGVAIDGNVAPNTRIDIPGVGTVTLNRQVRSGDGAGSAGIAVDMIHVVLETTTTSLLGGTTTVKVGEIVVGSASSAVTAN